ncbi:DIE2/ALG10 family protein (macronuclear) [Tetrahymena thermophila SB210]|uniref:Dol-P-Glc:Glc(2)Man(9)GlcNAc(2)-PP-Dol alpha-1,2-glucosyltransferase n=1 Tax=Tetrahymena thermophila (strain SB210) TaxID=312017 RepID=I7ML34_TETTS|nr:DIE2/ALG10 family protein [Tetrahymena thermophila SB210]EAS01091.2 DIE2/ALG10 family protein [Tetrahymena thermophila SB210]|eukprot:XP_001021336.2 DIE2/ALG10 family protein [Tetrahymena thermophila SB210]
MDEFFHLDQLDHYLNGDWAYWNDKLTTPPGTYFLFYPFLKLGQFFGFKNTLLGARLLNSFLLGSAILVFLKKIFQEINSKDKVFLSYYVLFTPTIYFFSHLFYTDSASLVTCLGMYYYSKKQKFTLSGLFGLVSILIRQTNVIWILYICLISFIDQNLKAFQEKSFMHSSKSLIGLLFKNIFSIARMFKMQIILVIAFTCFVIYNGSIVLGDKLNHESSFHPTQLLYLSLFAFLNLPLSVKAYFSNLKDTLKNQKVAFLILLAISLGVIHKFTFAHKFILSDNRHYIFYIWKNFYGRYPIFKYLMAPVYSFSIAFILNIFKQNGIQQLNWPC